MGGYRWSRRARTSSELDAGEGRGVLDDRRLPLQAAPAGVAWLSTQATALERALLRRHQVLVGDVVEERVCEGGVRVERVDDVADGSQNVADDSATPVQDCRCHRM